ncbi:hypothetical protein Tco_0442511 [Tanacetum coccineum]
MVPNIWSPVKVAYDKYALWGISHLREQRKSFYAYARGMQLRGDVYYTKRILAVTHVKVMRKHRYGYLEEIVVRRTDNVLYRFKEDDFPRLRMYDIEDMLLLVVIEQSIAWSGIGLEDVQTSYHSNFMFSIIMSTPDYIYPVIVPSDSDTEDAFSSTNTPNYTLASSDYFPASPGNTSPDPSDDLSNDESPIPPQAPIAPPTALPPSPVLPLSPMFDSQDLFLPKEILPPKKRARS